MQDEAAQQWRALASQQQEEDAYLLQLAGEGNTSLAEVQRLQVVADTSSSSISHLGAKLPALQELNLNNSLLESLRDLGTGFSMLAVLWVSRCSLSGLEGAGALPNLRELYASYNDIRDLQPLGAGCEQLEVLDLEGNCIADEDSVAQLEGCPGLTSLVLAGNPLCQSLPRYRARIVAALPSLRSLDDQEVIGAELDEADDSDLLLQQAPLQTVNGCSSRAEAGNGDSAVVGSPDMHMTSSHSLQASLAHQLDSSEQQAVPNGLSSSPALTSLAGLIGSKPVLGSPESIAAAKATAAASGLPSVHTPSSVPLSRATSLLMRSELSMVSEGIKHARVGVDSHEFQQIEMSLLVSTADGCPSGTTLHHLSGWGSAPATAYPGSGASHTSGMSAWSTPPATASSFGAPGRPSSGPLPPSSPSLAASLMPAGAATWMRTLRTSQQLQAKLQDFEHGHGCSRRPGSDGDMRGRSGSPNQACSIERGSSGCYPSSSPAYNPVSPYTTSACSPSHSRPHSSRGEQTFGETSQGRTRPGTGSSTGGAPAGQQQLLRPSSGQLPLPPRLPHDDNSATSISGPPAKAPVFPPEAPPRTAAATAAASRPFSARLATGSASAARTGTAALSSSASAASTSAAGLYWAKHRIAATKDGSEQGRHSAASATGGASFAGAGVGGAAPGLLQRGSDGTEDGGGSSQLTHGRDASSTFGGSLAKDLRRWKGATKAAAAQDGSSTVPISACVASSAHAKVRHSAAHAGHASTAQGGKDGYFLSSSMDHATLLAELRRWKVETADRALLDEEGGIPSVGGPAGVMQAWADPADSDGHPRTVHADVLQLGTESDGIEADAEMPLLTPARLYSGASSQGKCASVTPPSTTSAVPVPTAQHWVAQDNGEHLLAPSFVPGTAQHGHVAVSSLTGSHITSAAGLLLGGQGRGPSKMPLAKAVRDTAGRNGNVSCAAVKSALRPLCAAQGPKAGSGQAERSEHHLHQHIYSGSSVSGPAHDARPALNRTASSGLGSSTTAAVASPSSGLSRTALPGVAAQPQPAGSTSRVDNKSRGRPDSGQEVSSVDLPRQGSLQRGGGADYKAGAEYRVLSIGGEVDLCIVNPRPRFRQAATSDDEGPG